MHSHDRYAHDILVAIEAQQQVSQRSLSQRIGIALGLTNFLMRRLVRKGWVRVIRISPTRVRYLLTPEGIAEKARMSRLLLQDSVRFYLTVRDRIHKSLSAAAVASADRASRIVFFGAGEVAEIAYVCLQETTFQLVGVIDESPRQRFFGVPVYSADDLQCGLLRGTRFDRLIVTTLDDREAIRARLAQTGLTPEQVYWL